MFRREKLSFFLDGTSARECVNIHGQIWEMAPPQLLPR
jgi:hypothetical protein